MTSILPREKVNATKQSPNDYFSGMVGRSDLKKGRDEIPKRNSNTAKIKNAPFEELFLIKILI